MRKIHSAMQIIHRKAFMVAENSQLVNIGALKKHINFINHMNHKAIYSGMPIAYIQTGAYLQNSSP